MAEEPHDRLRKLRIAKGFASATDAARAFGWPENTYKSHENGMRGVKPDVARRYARAFGSSPAYILTGEQQSTPIVSTVEAAPILGIVAAGAWRGGDDYFEDDTFVPKVARGDVSMSRQYAVRVEGESVNRVIQNGAYAICASLDAYPGGAPPGSLVHVIREVDGALEHTIKELRVTAKGLLLMPISTDPAHQEPLAMTDNAYQRIVIQGVVIGTYRPL